jgi:hypothetical protein
MNNRIAPGQQVFTMPFQGIKRGKVSNMGELEDLVNMRVTDQGLVPYRYETIKHLAEASIKYLQPVKVEAESLTGGNVDGRIDTGTTRDVYPYTSIPFTVKNPAPGFQDVAFTTRQESITALTSVYTSDKNQDLSFTLKVESMVNVLAPQTVVTAQWALISSANVLKATYPIALIDNTGESFLLDQPFSVDWSGTVQMEEGDRLTLFISVENLDETRTPSGSADYADLDITSTNAVFDIFINQETIEQVQNSNFKGIVVHRGPYFENYIGHNLNSVIVYRGTDVGTLIYQTSTATIRSVHTLANYLIILTTSETFRYLRVDNTYKLININNEIKASVNYDVVVNPSTQQYQTTSETWRADMISEIKEIIAEKGNEGYTTGLMTWRAAYKLIDGSYAMSTVPRLVGVTAADWVLYKTAIPSRYKIDIPVITYKAAFNKSDFQVIENSKDIIDSVVIFMSKPVIRYDYEAIINDQSKLPGAGPNRTALFSDSSLYVASEELKSIADPGNWHKVLEVSFTELIEGTGTVEQKIDLARFYKDYASRESLPVDQNTHHRLTAQAAFVYNSRLWIGDINRRLAIHHNSRLVYEPSTGTELQFAFAYNIQTAGGFKRTVKIINAKVSINPQQQMTLYLPILAYPDQRAVSLTIYHFHAGRWRRTRHFNFKKSVTHNYAYYYEPDNINKIVSEAYYLSAGVEPSFTVQADLLSAPVDDSLTYNDRDEQLSSNVFMLSNLFNPLIYPALQTYQAGNGTIKYFSAGSFPVSEGQFGQYPVHIFTSSGIYAADIGTGAVIIPSVIPVSPDVALSCPISSNMGSFFTTRNGIMVINGRQVTKLSDDLEGDITPVPKSDKGGRFAFYSDHPQTIRLGSILTDIANVKTEYSSMVLGFDSINNRLLCSVPSKNYCYVLQLSNRTWSRQSRAFAYFAHDFPSTLGVHINPSNNRQQVYDITVEQRNGYIDTHFHSGVFNINTNHRTKVKESLLMCRVKTSNTKRVAVALFASNDGINFTRVSASDRNKGKVNDVQLTYCPASYKFFLVAAWANVDLSYDNLMQAFSMQFEIRYTHRLRSY